MFFKQISYFTLLTCIVCSFSFSQSQNLPEVKVHPAREFAPLAAFGIGSLVMGGYLFTIQQTSYNPSVNYVTGNPKAMRNAIIMSGVGAALATGSYFYQIWRFQDKNREVAFHAGGSPTGLPTILATFIF